MTQRPLHPAREHGLSRLESGLDTLPAFSKTLPQDAFPTLDVWFAPLNPSHRLIHKFGPALDTYMPASAHVE